MATRTIVLPDITDTDDGLAISVTRINGRAVIGVGYMSGTGFNCGANVDPSELTAAQRNILQQCMQAILAIAKPKMGF
jgi:hypothetical protein